MGRLKIEPNGTIDVELAKDRFYGAARKDVHVFMEQAADRIIEVIGSPDAASMIFVVLDEFEIYDNDIFYLYAGVTQKHLDTFVAFIIANKIAIDKRLPKNLPFISRRIVKELLNDYKDGVRIIGESDARFSFQAIESFITVRKPRHITVTFSTQNPKKKSAGFLAKLLSKFTKK
jgi:hypothetical protein